MKQILTIKLQLLLAFLLFGTAQQVQAQSFTGTWSTNVDEREIKITQHPNGNVTFGLGDYSFSGKTTKNLAKMGQTVTGTYTISPGFSVRENPVGGTRKPKPVDHDKYGDRGTFTMTIDANGQTFKGEWVNAADASKKGPLTGRRINQVSASAIANADKKEELSKRKVDISGLDIKPHKPAVPWVGTWKGDGQNFKIVQSSSTEIRGKRSFTDKNGHTIESDFTASFAYVSKDGKEITYKGTCTERNRTTNHTLSVPIPISLSTSSENAYTTISVFLDYTNPKKKPAIFVGRNYTLNRISQDVPNMNSYR